ncbi:MAG TPA: Sec-independent protein translocase subunit TatA [Burkholderiaceae bacterium]|jgi:sec-independent protein translocase protein TatA|nr:Sec-independent protein translocase subunit TatA [Burkholderiaceae bacterium]
MGSLSLTHWLIVLLVVVLVFGTSKLRNLGKDLGGAIKGFKEGMREAGSEEKPPPQHVTDASAAGTIDVQAKEKSGP